MKGQERIDLRLKKGVNGQIAFQLNDRLVNRKICSVAFITSGNQGRTYTGEFMKANARNSPFFLNLFDKNEFHFCIDCPLNIWSPFSWGREFTFEPRYLSLSSCFFRYYDSLSTNEGIGLIIGYA